MQIFSILNFKRLFDDRYQKTDDKVKRAKYIGKVSVHDNDKVWS